MNMIMILIVDNIHNYKETFYHSILLPEDLQNKYNMMLLDKPKKMMKLSYCLKSYLANRLSLDNYSILYHEYGKPLKKSISITMNSIKKNISGRNKVQIFSI